MIVRDEARTLDTAIGSVRTIADEIVVLDTGSTDRTVEIAEAAGATVHHAGWNDDFAAARNACLQHVRGEWVLWLDGSERLEDASAESLRRFVDDEVDPDKLYMVMVEIPPLDPAGSAEQAARVRLMPNDPGLRFAGRLRESVRGAAEKAGMEIDMAPGRIIRHALQHDPRRRAAKARRDLELTAIEERQSGRLDPGLLIARGDAYANLDSPEPARAAYLAAIASAARGSTEMLDAYYGLLPTFDHDPAHRQQQLKTCLQALEVYPLDSQLLFAVGNYTQMQNRIDLARRSFEAAAQFGQVDLETWHLKELAEVVAVCLSVVQQLEGADDDARATLVAAVHRHPGSERLRRHLLDLHVRHGREANALELAERLSLAPDQRGPFCDAVRGACRAAVQEWTAALGYLQAAYVGGCRDSICMRWLVVTLMSNAQFEAARPVLAEWAELEPNSAELRSFLAALESKAAMAEPAEPDRQFRFDLPDDSITVAPAHRSGADARDHPESVPSDSDRTR
jgi:tetratricopeptide (TPR) repeat protein